jgi:Phosphotransferase enzyme family
MDTVHKVFQLQRTDRDQAEDLLLALIRDTLPLDVERVRLRPVAISLNSINGLLTLKDGSTLFFKTHTEDGAMVREYSNASLLSEAGYPVLQPLHVSTEVGRQLLIYPVVDDPLVFDAAWAIEDGTGGDLRRLADAQGGADHQLREIYRATIRWQSAKDAASAPVHQLFSHRLTGGRLASFYTPQDRLGLPVGELTIREILQARWVINGQRYQETLNDLISRAVRLLDPHQAGPSVVGHGDAHNGNLFLVDGGTDVLYFDPAFAGRHDPLLDIVKPLYHNVFASWMYFPHTKAAQTNVRVEYGDDTLAINHDYQVHPVRRMFLRSKVENVLVPLLADLATRDWIRPDWRTRMKMALMCCPLLTIKLANPQTVPSEIAFLGLASAVEMGADSRETRSLIDQVLDEAGVS